MLLIVSDRSAFRRDLSIALTARGIFCFSVPYETARFYCDEKDIGGALLDGIPRIDLAEQLCRDFVGRYPEMPVAVLLRPEVIPDLPASRLIRLSGSDPAVEPVESFCLELCGWRQELSTYALTVGNDPEKTRLLGYPLPLSAREHILLRCLFYRAPRLTSPDDLLSLCFPEGTQKIGNLSVLISRINRASKTVCGFPLIVSEYGKGYRLTGGIVSKEK